MEGARTNTRCTPEKELHQVLLKTWPAGDRWEHLALPPSRLPPTDRSESPTKHTVYSVRAVNELKVTWSYYIRGLCRALRITKSRSELLLWKDFLSGRKNRDIARSQAVTRLHHNVNKVLGADGGQCLQSLLNAHPAKKLAHLSLWVMKAMEDVSRFKQRTPNTECSVTPFPIVNSPPRPPFRDVLFG